MKLKLFLLFIFSIQLYFAQQTLTELSISNYSPQLVLQRNTDVGGYTQGIQTKLSNGVNNWFFGNLHGDSWIVAKGDYQGYKFSVNSNGNVGIGMLNPLSRLDIVGNNNSNNEVNSIIRKTGTYGGSNIFRLEYHSSSDLEINSGYTATGHRYGSYFDFNIVNNHVGGDWGKINFITNNTVNMSISPEGNVGIGTANPQNKLDVNGVIHAKEVKIDLNGWADFVFKKDYPLPTLEQVEKHIVEKGHLPNIPSEKEVLEKGLSIGESQKLLLQKIEELTLYVIEINKQNKEMKEKIQTLENK